MALPAIRDIRRHFPGETLAVAARPSVSELFRAVPGVDRIAVLKSAQDIASLQASIGLLLPNSFGSALTLKRAGVKERWGYRADWRGLLLTRAVRRPRRKVHVGRIRFAPCPRARRRDWSADTADRRAGACARVGRGAVGRSWLEAGSGAGGHRSRRGVWPRQTMAFKRFAELSTQLRQENGAACVIIGRVEDRDATNDVDGINLVGHTDLLMLMGVLSHCRALVANDSGALHLAAALGVPVVGIYGPTDERYSHPLAAVEGADDRTRTLAEPVFCRPCFLADCPIDHRCMKRISTGRVLDNVRPFLQETHE